MQPSKEQPKKPAGGETDVKKVDLPEKTAKPKTIPLLNSAAIAFSRGVDLEAANSLSEKLRESGNQSIAFVLAVDIRSSARHMLFVEDFEEYAKDLSGFINYFRAVVNRWGGWFDKFTGDGAIAFWLGDEIVMEKIFSTIVNLHASFLLTTLPAFRQISGCIPEDFGLAIGCDLGKCTVTDLVAPPNAVLFERFAKGEPTARPLSALSPNGSITVLGRAVVGAVRMSNEARRHQTVFNENAGEDLFTHRHMLQAGAGIDVRRIRVNNKELQMHQSAYLLEFDPIKSAIDQDSEGTLTSDASPGGDERTRK